MLASRRKRASLFRFLAIGLFLLSAFVWAGPTMATDSVAATAEGHTPAMRIHARYAVHKNFDRLVFKLPSSATATAHQDGATLQVRFTAGAIALTGDAVHGRRMLAMSLDDSLATIRLAPDVHVHAWRSSDMLVIDAPDSSTANAPVVASPVAASRPSPPAKPGRGSTSFPVAGQPTQQAPAAASVSPADRKPAPAASSDAAVAGVAAAPPKHALAGPTTPGPIASGRGQTPSFDAQTGLPHPVSITVLPEAPGMGPGLLVPFGRDVGAAAFLRGDEGRVVFDAAQSFDLSGLKDDTAFGGVTEQLLSDGTQLRLRLGRASRLRLVRREDGWAILLQPAAAPGPQLSPIVGQNRQGVVAIDVNAAGRVVVVGDDLTGGRLLVGTQRGQGQYLVSPHASAEAAILPSWQGLVVLPTSDRVILSETHTGFELSSVNAPPLAMTWPEQQTGAWPDGRAMTRLFDFSDTSPEVSHRLLGQALRDAAAVPKLARFSSRIGVAQVMLAQGMDVEAAAVVRTAQADDPAAHDARCVECLAALASWMSARAGGTEAPDVQVDLAKFGDSDEGAFLKALLAPGIAETEGRAAAVASTWPLLSSYSPMLRRFMLQPVADVLFRGGQKTALAAFLAAFPDPSLDLARANVLCTQGKTDACLKLLDKVAAGHDRLARANALEQSTLARLASGRTTPDSAAQALTQQLYAWRGGDRELRIRQRIAKLRVQAGQWLPALAMLGDIDSKFPQAHEDVHAAKTALVAELLKGDAIAKVSAIDLVAIADSTSDVMEDGDAGFAPALIDKLLALDLAGRADPLLRRLFERAKDPRIKAELGVRLADTMLDGGDASAALATLAASDDAELGPAIVLRRALLRARLLAQSGKPTQALAALSGLHSREASELAATITEGQHDWTNAVAALKALVFDPQFAAVPEADQRALVLRLARDEAEAGDQAGLHDLHQTKAGQFQAGPNAALFAVLTSEPVRTTADLPRSAIEVKALQTVPATLARPRHF